MKAVLLEENGGPEMLTIKEIDEPTTTEGSVKIRIKAFGINRIELFQRQGTIGKLQSPVTPGIEAVGEVTEDRSGKFQIGQKVITVMGGMGFSRQGSYAEYIVSPADNTLAIPGNISFEELAAIPETFGTISVALEKDLKIKAGEAILIRGGTTATGIAALLYAKMKGLRVITTTRNENKVAKLRCVGADYVIVDNGEIAARVREIIAGGADKALEIIGVSVLSDTILSVKAFGEVAMIGILGGAPVLKNFDMMTQSGDNVKLSFTKSGLLGTKYYPLSDTPLQLIASNIASGKMPSIKSSTFAFHEIAAAHALMEKNKADGKIVITL